MVKYEWDESNGVSVPTNKLMTIDADEYYVGMPLKKVDASTVAPTDGDPEYICLAQRNAGDEIRPLQIPVQEVFPDAVYTKIMEDGTEEQVRFGGGGKIKPEQLPEGYPYDAGSFYYDNSGFKSEDEMIAGTPIFKVSDDTPLYNELLGAKLSVNNDESVVSEDTLTYMDGVCAIGEYVLVVYADNTQLGSGIKFPTAGIYMFVPEITITLSKNGIKTIDPKFLPKITIVQDGYDDAAMGVMATIAAAYTCTANATFLDVMQMMMTKTLPPVELYTFNERGLCHCYGGDVTLVMKEGEPYLSISFFYTTGYGDGYKGVSWYYGDNIEVGDY